MNNRCIFFSLVFLIFPFAAFPQIQDHPDLPDSIYSGEQGPFHVQGIAVDQKNGFVYFSFTDKLVKTDLNGNLIGSVTGFTGHLGDITLDTAGNRIYGSLEYKNDDIGREISQKLGLENKNPVGFYIAIFNAAAIIRPDMDAAGGNLVKTVYLREVVKDYLAEVRVGKHTARHRFGCSGIDGITIGPPVGESGARERYLYVAYGIYGDTARSDNDNQVILKYDFSDFDELSRELSQKDPHKSGPEKPLDKYFVETGNTTYGVQNLAFDPSTGNFFIAVYPGKKEKFPNYSLFVIDGSKAPQWTEVAWDDKNHRVKSLTLLQPETANGDSGIKGWHFKWGATGLCPVGHSLFYISHNMKLGDGGQATTLYKYRWRGGADDPFILAK